MNKNQLCKIKVIWILIADFKDTGHFMRHFYASVNGLLFKKQEIPCF